LIKDLENEVKYVKEAKEKIENDLSLLEQQFSQK